MADERASWEESRLLIMREMSRMATAMDEVVDRLGSIERQLGIAEEREKIREAGYNRRAVLWGGLWGGVVALIIAAINWLVAPHK